jgi:hypothetical protein
MSTVSLAADNAGALAFKPGDRGGFEFDTGLLRGKLRPAGKSLGLVSVIHAPSGIMLDRGDGGYGLFSHYRVFTRNQRYGHGAWDWPSTARLRSDGAVEVRWLVDTNWPFAMRAVYRWTAADTLDLETIVEPQQDLRDFESFLASYFASRFTNCLVYADESKIGAGHSGFLAAGREFGQWQMFPRDSAAIAIIQDGRWQLDPSPVAWAIRPKLAQPIGVRRDPASGLTAALMAPREDCFALATPEEREGHYSLYLSLFGRDMKAGETARARARLVIASSFSAAKIIGSEAVVR